MHIKEFLGNMFLPEKAKAFYADYDTDLEECSKAFFLDDVYDHPCWKVTMPDVEINDGEKEVCSYYLEIHGDDFGYISKIERYRDNYMYNDRVTRFPKATEAAAEEFLKRTTRRQWTRTLSFRITVCLGGGDGGDIDVETYVTEQEYNYMLMGCSHDEDIESFRELEKLCRRLEREGRWEVKNELPDEYTSDACFILRYADSVYDDVMGIDTVPENPVFAVYIHSVGLPDAETGQSAFAWYDSKKEFIRGLLRFLKEQRKAQLNLDGNNIAEEYDAITAELKGYASMPGVEELALAGKAWDAGSLHLEIVAAERFPQVTKDFRENVMEMCGDLLIDYEDLDDDLNDETDDPLYAAYQALRSVPYLPKQGFIRAFQTIADGVESWAAL